MMTAQFFVLCPIRCSAYANQLGSAEMYTMAARLVHPGYTSILSLKKRYMLSSLQTFVEFHHISPVLEMRECRPVEHIRMFALFALVLLTYLDLMVGFSVGQSALCFLTVLGSS